MKHSYGATLDAALRFFYTQFGSYVGLGQAPRLKELDPWSKTWVFDQIDGPQDTKLTALRSVKVSYLLDKVEHEAMLDLHARYESSKAPNADEKDPYTLTWYVIGIKLNEGDDNWKEVSVTPPAEANLPPPSPPFPKVPGVKWIPPQH